ncbi:MAG: 3'-5' exonuclease [Xanthomonadales bacterium]|nr:3'-5' exonuclease [Xanthomonadales bacterium]
MSLWRSARLAWSRRQCRLPIQQETLTARPPTASTGFDELDIVVLDLETTGLDPRRDQVLSAGWVCVSSGRIELSSAQEVPVRPHGEAGVGQSAIIHGLLDSDLADACDELGLLQILLPILAGRVVAAHAAAIERGFLRAMLHRHGGVALPNPFIDTMKLERMLLEGRGERIEERGDALTLARARARHQLPAHSQHSAGSDALACAELLLAQVENLGGHARVRLRTLV